MIGRLVSILSFLLISLSTYAQIPTAPNITDEKGKRQGDWVIYYDTEWEEIEDSSNAEFYRKISYVNDKPEGLVKDYFASGVNQWEGTMISDRPDLSDGFIKYYYENGNIEKEGMMKKNKSIGEWKNYTYLGKLSHISIYINDVEQGFDLKFNEAFKLFNQKNFESAMDKLEEVVLDLNELLNYNENNIVADYLAGIANIYSSMGQYQRALELNNKCLALRGSIFGKEHSDYAFSLNNLSRNYAQTGQYKRSLKLSEECLALFGKIYGKEHPYYATILNNLASNYSDLGQYERSLELNNECLSLGERIYGKIHPDYARSLNNLAFCYSELGEYEIALELDKEALAVYEKIYGKEHQLYAISLNNLAHNYSKLGQYEMYLKLNKETLELHESILGKNHPDYLNSLSNLGQSYFILGQYERALEIDKECLALREKICGKNHPDYLASLNNLAANYSELGQYEKSIELNKENLAIREKLYGRVHPDYVISLNNLASNYSDLGKYEKSIELNKDNLAIKEKLYGKEHPDYLASLNNLSNAFWHLGKYEKSLEILKETPALIAMKYGKENQFYQTIIGNLSFNYSKLENYISCDSLILQSYQIFERLYAKNKIGLSEKEKENYIEELKLYFRYLTNYTIFRKLEKPSLISNISSASINLKGTLLNSNNQIQNEIFNSKDTNFINLYERWKIGKLQLCKYYELSLQELEKNGVDIKAEEERVNTLEQDLSRKSLSFAESQKRYTWEEVKNKLNPNESYLELIRTNYYDFEKDRSTDTVYYAALIIDHSTVEHPELVVLEKGAQLEQSGFKYYSSFSSGRNKQRLDEYSYQNYWSAIAEKLKGKKRIYVSSDGVYNKINLNVLYNTETGKYLGEEMDIRLVTSGRDLFKTYPETNEELTAVLVGSPKYDLIEEQVQDDDLLVSRDLQQNWIDSLSRGWSVSSLPGTAIEVSNISNLMTKNNWEVTTYKEEEAMEGKVKSVSSPTVLHIATHGYFFEDVEKEKESPTRMMGIDSKKATQNPLLRSGLLFAGAKNTLNGNPPESGDNGLLTSYEASYMDLRGTELVVLSACNTARGEIKNGEGVYGLQRAIQQAGAENIIMSMWKVDDKVTQDFMTNFYDLWLSGKTKRDAFNQTQMIIKEKYKYPYYWGAFVMIGN